MKRIRTLGFLAIAGFLCAIGPRADAAIAVSLHASNSGIGSMTFSQVGNTLTINETWTGSGPGVLQLSGLDANVNYTIIKNITNNSGGTWTRFANELLDPGFDAGIDPSPQPAFVPAGFSTSNDFDGLSFAQGSPGFPRTSSAFSTVFSDELTDARDFIDFSNGSVATGGIFDVTFGLRDNAAANQPFLLFQRPNASSRGEIPEPATCLMWGLGALGLGMARLRRRSAIKA